MSVLRVLIVEDSENDADLLVRHLEGGGYEPVWERVETATEMMAALNRQEWDVVLANYSLPQFSALAALTLVHESGLDIPFIIVSGTIGEETAVAALRAGAHDFLLKGALARLIPAIERERCEAEGRRQRRRTEEMLRRLSSAVEQTADCILITDRDGVIEYVNPAFERVTGYAQEEVLDKTPRLLKSGKQSQKFFERLWETILSGKVFRAEFINRKKSGKLFYEEKTITPIKDAQGNITHFVSVGRDITQQKRLEEALRESEALFRSLADTVAAGIFIYRGTRFVYANAASEVMSGYTRDELLAMNIGDVIHPDFRRLVKERASVRQHGGAVPSHYEVKILSKTGEERWLDVSATTILFQGQPAVLATAFDITERRQIEEQLRQSQKMEAVGRLAGGIAHDFNNLLTVITGYSEIVLGQLGEDDQKRRHVEEIKKAGERAASLTRQLLAFSRRQSLVPKVLDLNAVVTDMEKMLQRLIGEDIELRIVLEPALGRVKADAGQIEQVIMNLAVNARDAMPEGGTLVIETANVDLDLTYTRYHAGLEPAPYVMLAMSDTGCGMDAETQAHIFEPFFTTKGEGKGTGLGLATVYGIVKQSGGHISVYSEPGQGTTFKMYLPRTEEANEPLEMSAVPTELLRGWETVLLVEDEKGVRALAREFLEINGYTVLEAKDGVEALRVAEQHEGPIHLLLTDVVMPQMSGPELARRLASVRPEAKVLYMSGYTSKAGLQAGLLAPSAPLLQKPFTLDSLAMKVREVLQSGEE